eukprot:CAMPEP_0114593598 /NCGR_PEP_ID=MMETSP0125-20121206/15185_1 /TAXON_ID=485358 ORGANISM="Aristerostoma sp., Strain ATCC 50986" /NCGR_SAMPLE_ID=MMETSP0125 /ASSEMBLY_ACC=CAM_ASM_000245 /LENGTH=65 /DNA_ID=CAMNT_0001792923 /DNA_START=100 /DNA_END=297 /DNA_ORIENTATION=-
MGFKDIRKNVKYIKKYSGNLHLVVAKLSEKKSGSSSEEEGGDGEGEDEQNTSNQEDDAENYGGSN